MQYGLHFHGCGKPGVGTLSCLPQGGAQVVQVSVGWVVGVPSLGFAALAWVVTSQ